MNYTGHENHSISLPDAAAMTQRFRNANPPGTIISEYFGADAINSILSQPGCVGIRLYYAMDDNSVQHHVISGVDANGDDLFNGVLADNGQTCPPNCATVNPLNS
jgi:hypothetical protein